MAPWSHITPKGGEGSQVREGGAPYPPWGLPEASVPAWGDPTHQSSSNEGVAPGSHHTEGMHANVLRARGADHPLWGGRLGLPAPLRGPNMPKFLQQGVGSRKPSHGRSQGAGHPPWARPSPPLGRAGPAGPLMGVSHANVLRTRGWPLEAITQKGRRGEPGGAGHPARGWAIPWGGLGLLAGCTPVSLSCMAIC